MLVTDLAQGLDVVNPASEMGPHAGNEDRRHLGLFNVRVDKALKGLNVESGRLCFRGNWNGAQVNQRKKEEGKKEKGPHQA